MKNQRKSAKPANKSKGHPEHITADVSLTEENKKTIKKIQKKVLKNKQRVQRIAQDAKEESPPPCRFPQCVNYDPAATKYCTMACRGDHADHTRIHEGGKKAKAREGMFRTVVLCYNPDCRYHSRKAKATDYCSPQCKLDHHDSVVREELQNQAGDSLGGDTRDPSKKERKAAKAAEKAERKARKLEKKAVKDHAKKEAKRAKKEAKLLKKIGKADKKYLKKLNKGKGVKKAEEAPDEDSSTVLMDNPPKSSIVLMELPSFFLHLPKPVMLTAAQAGKTFGKIARSFMRMLKDDMPSCFDFGSEDLGIKQEGKVRFSTLH